MIVSKKNIAKDFVLNILSNALPVVVLQLIVQPYLASQLGAEENGKFITIMSILHFVVMLFGSTLHTTRLISETKYKESNQQGDFNLGVIILCIPCLIITSLGCYILKCSILDTIIISLLAVVWMIKDYAIVEYRLKLEYRKILINNSIWSIGYLMGIPLFKIFPHWYIIILMGTTLSLIYTFSSTTILNESINKTPLFHQTSKSFGLLFLSSLMSVFIMNYDRFVIFALMTGAAVSTYYSAAIMGKLVSMVSAPIGNVVLSYIVNLKTISSKAYNKITLCICGLSIVSYLISISVSPFLLRLLYPDWAEESMALIYLTCGISSFDLIRQLLIPFIIRFCKLSFQPKIAGLHVTLYAIGGTLSLIYYGLLGFVFTNLIISILVVIAVWYIGRYNIR